MFRRDGILYSGMNEYLIIKDLDRSEDWMPRVHQCEYQGCREHIAINDRYCSKHIHCQHHSKINNKLYNKFERDKQSNSFYQSSQWSNTRSIVFDRDNGICQACGNVVDDHKIVDHIVALKLSASKRFNTDNLWTLCYKCHNRKTKLEQKMLKDGKVNILKHCDRLWWAKVLKEKAK